MPSLKEFLQIINRNNEVNSNVNYNINGIEINTEADRKKLKKLKRALLEAMDEFIQECNKVPMAKSVEEARRASEATSYRRLFREELEKTEEGELPSQIIELYENLGNSIQIDKNGVCSVCLKERKIYVDDPELIHLIEKLEIYDKDDENSIYSYIRPIKQNIIRNMFLNPSDKELDTDTLEAVGKKRNIPKYFLDVLTDGTIIVEFNGQRHCLPYKFSKYISSMQGLINENQLAEEINDILATYMEKLKAEGIKYSLTAVKELTDWMNDEYNNLTILFDGERYYAVDKQTKSVAFLNDKQCEFLNKISNQAIKILYRKNKVRRKRKGLELDSDGNYKATEEPIKYVEYGTHKTLKQLMNLGYEFETKDEKKDYIDEMADWKIIITNPFGGLEIKSAREWAKLNMPYTNKMIGLVRDFNGKPNEFYDYLYDKAKRDFEEKPLGEKLRTFRHNLRAINSVIDTRDNQPVIAMKKDDEPKKKEIITIEEDGSISIEEEPEKSEAEDQTNNTIKGFKKYIDNKYKIPHAIKIVKSIVELTNMSLMNAHIRHEREKKAIRIQRSNIKKQNEERKRGIRYASYTQNVPEQDSKFDRRGNLQYIQSLKIFNTTKQYVDKINTGIIDEATQYADNIDMRDGRYYKNAAYIKSTVESKEIDKE